jgi:hypothetical protein
MKERLNSGHRSWLWSHVTTPVVSRRPMVVTRSCDGTHSNMWVPILPTSERTTSTTHSMKGSGATIGVLYPWYRRTPVTARPRNSARDTPGLPRAALGGFHYRNCRYPYGQLCTKYPSPRDSHPLKRRHRPLQRQDKTAPGRTDSKSLSKKVKPGPHGTDSKNLLELVHLSVRNTL